MSISSRKHHREAGDRRPRHTRPHPSKRTAEELAVSLKQAYADEDAVIE